MKSASTFAMSTGTRSRCSSSKSWIQARAAFGPGELVRTLGDDPQAEVLQHRQQVGDRHGLAELDDLQVHALGLLLGRAMQVEAQRLRLARAAPPGRRGRRAQSRGDDVFLVRHREGAPIAVGERDARRLRPCSPPRRRAAGPSRSGPLRRSGARSPRSRLWALRRGRCARRHARGRGWSRRSVPGFRRSCRRSLRARSARCAGALRCCSDRAARRSGTNRSDDTDRGVRAGAPCGARTG